jgi:hypothetical protein
MPFHEIQTSGDSNRGTAQSVSSLTFSDIFEQSRKTVDAVAREGALFACGTVGGAGSEFQKDPIGTVARAGSTLTVGAGLGALAATEVPVLIAGAAVTGLALTGKWAYDTFNQDDPRNRERFTGMGKAMHDVWNNSDKRTFDASVQKMQEGIGPIAIDVGLMAIGGGGAHFAARHTPKLATRICMDSELTPAAVPNYFSGRAGTLLLEWSDLAFFKKRSSPVRVDKGTPESLPARIELLNAKAGLQKSEPQGHNFLSLIDKQITPQDKYKTGGYSFFFSEKAYKNR